MDMVSIEQKELQESAICISRIVHGSRSVIEDASVRNLGNSIFSTHAESSQAQAEIASAISRIVALYGTNTRKLVERLFIERDKFPAAVEEFRAHLGSLFQKELEAKSKLPTTEQLMTKLRDVLAQNRNIDQETLAIILFGSWARGEQRADSDVDYLYFMKSDKKPGKVLRDAIAKVLPVESEPDGWVSSTDEIADDLYGKSARFHRGFRIITDLPEIENLIAAMKGIENPNLVHDHIPTTNQE